MPMQETLAPIGDLFADMTDLNRLADIRDRLYELGARATQAIWSAAADRGARSEWDTANDPVEDVIVLRALRRGAVFSRGLPEKGPTAEVIQYRIDLMERLRSTRIVDLVGADRANRGVAEPRPCTIPTLRAARTLHECVETPRRFLHESAMACLYAIIREVYAISPNDFIAGGARAVEGGMATAFVTGECCRALLSLKLALDQTADLMAQFDRLERAIAEPTAPFLPEWRRFECETEVRYFVAALAKLRPGALLDFREWPQAASFDAPDARRYLDEALGDMVDQLTCGLLALRNVLRDLEIFRSDEKTAELKQTSGRLRAITGYAWSESAHGIAMRVLGNVEDAVKNLSDALHPAGGASGKDRWSNAAEVLQHEGRRIVRALGPAHQYLAGVLQRELSRVNGSQGDPCDYPELAFACAALCLLDTVERCGRQDPNLLRASQVLKDKLSETGRYPRGIPFHVQPGGYALHASGMEIMIALARILDYDPRDLPATMAAHMVFYFDDLQRELISHGQGTEGGFPSDDPIQPPRPCLWQTGIAVDALARLARLLDQKINERVLRNFTVLRPGKRDLRLDNAVYPDCGLWKTQSGRTLFDLLLAMYGHLAGLDLTRARACGTDPIWSAILHGPPGTGKTSLVEALAATAEAPLVTITPSDLLLAGTENLEKRSRDVFDALSMLTECVILFDEFDSVVRTRGREPIPPVRVQGGMTVFDFLTASMLPRLQRLYREARDHRVVYVLATNYVKGLDEAAVRSGRFDHKHSVFPPDPVSRAGYCLKALIPLAKADEERWKAADPGGVQFRSRVVELLEKTAWGSIGSLAQRGWMRPPRNGSAPPDSAGAFLRGNPPAGQWKPDVMIDVTEYLEASGYLFDGRSWAHDSRKPQDCTRESEALRDLVQRENPDRYQEIANTIVIP